MILPQSGVVVLSLVTATVISVASSQGVDLTIVPEAKGKDVVFSVVSKIHSSRIFAFDNQLLRRIAWVESKDGTDSNTYRADYHGGIWQVDETLLLETQNSSINLGLEAIHKDVGEHFNIDWLSVTWEDLRKPLYSGLAAQLFLSITEEPIPLASDIDGQAQYWNQYYNASGTAEEFEQDVLELLSRRECPVNVDLFFVLDSSGSIGDIKYNMIKASTSQFVSGLHVGEDDDRVGVIVFGDFGRVEFNLNAHKDKQSLLNAIKAIPYLGETTNTADALQLLVTQGLAMNDNDAARTSVAIIITDGRSSDHKQTLNVAHNVHTMQPEILVYAIGVGSIDREELRAIASSPDFVSELTSFSNTQFLQTLEQRQFEICFEVSKPIVTGTIQQGTLDMGEQVRFQYSIPETEIEHQIKVCAQNERVVLYVSFSVPNPNEALHDAKLETDGCATTGVELTENSITSDADVTLYVVVKGLSNSSTVFTLMIDSQEPTTEPRITAGPIQVTTDALKSHGERESSSLLLATVFILGFLGLLAMC